MAHKAKLFASFIAMGAATLLVACGGEVDYGAVMVADASNNADTGTSSNPVLACVVLEQSKDGSLVTCDGNLVCKDGQAAKPGWAMLCASLVPAKDGKDGAAGVNGSNGKDGKDGTNCTVEMDSNNCAIVMCGSTKSAPICSGKDGKSGTNGTNGKDGQDGAQGQPGTNGTNGKDGKSGTNGSDGKDGVSCATANDPASGCAIIYCSDGSYSGVCPGANGKSGSNGKDGQPCSVSLSADGCKVSIICPLSSVYYTVPCTADAGSSDTSSDATSTADTSSADTGDSASADTAADATATDIAADSTATTNPCWGLKFTPQASGTPDCYTYDDKGVKIGTYSSPKPGVEIVTPNGVCGVWCQNGSMVCNGQAYGGWGPKTGVTCGWDGIVK